MDARSKRCRHGFGRAHRDGAGWRVRLRTWRRAVRAEAGERGAASGHGRQHHAAVARERCSASGGAGDPGRRAGHRTRAAHGNRQSRSAHSRKIHGLHASRGWTVVRECNCSGVSDELRRLKRDLQRARTADCERGRRSGAGICAERKCAGGNRNIRNRQRRVTGIGQCHGQSGAGIDGLIRERRGAVESVTFGFSSTFLIRLLYKSPTYILPSGVTSTPTGVAMLAASAGPPSPENPKLPLPAKAVMILLAPSTRRILLLPESEIKKLPAPFSETRSGEFRVRWWPRRRRRNFQAFLCRQSW